MQNIAQDGMRHSQHRSPFRLPRSLVAMNGCAKRIEKVFALRCMNWNAILRRESAMFTRLRRQASSSLQPSSTIRLVRWMDMPHHNFTPTLSSSTSRNARTARHAHCRSAASFSRSSMRRACIARSLPCGCNGLGYEIERGQHGQPEIKGYTQEYLEASSPRRAQIKEHLQEIGREGAGAAQVAAHRTRDSKDLLSREEVLERHRELAAKFGYQADQVVAKREEHIHKVEQQPEKIAQQSLTYSRNHVFERSAVQDERSILQAAMDRSMGEATYSQVRQEFEQRVMRGEFRLVERTDGQSRAAVHDSRDDSLGAGDRWLCEDWQSAQL